MPINPLVSGLTSVAYLVCLLLITGVQAFNPVNTSTNHYTGSQAPPNVNFFKSADAVRFTGLPSSSYLIPVGVTSATYPANSLFIYNENAVQLGFLSSNDRLITMTLADNLKLAASSDVTTGTGLRVSYSLAVSGSTLAFTSIMVGNEAGGMTWWMRHQTGTEYFFGFTKFAYKSTFGQVLTNISTYTATTNTRGPVGIRQSDTQDCIVFCKNSEFVAFLKRANLNVIHAPVYSGGDSNACELDNMNRERYFFLIMKLMPILKKFEIITWMTDTDALGTADLSAYGTANTIMNAGHFQYIAVLMDQSAPSNLVFVNKLNMTIIAPTVAFGTAGLAKQLPTAMNQLNDKYWMFYFLKTGDAKFRSSYLTMNDQCIARDGTGMCITCAMNTYRVRLQSYSICTDTSHAEYQKGISIATSFFVDCQQTGCLNCLFNYTKCTICDVASSYYLLTDTCYHQAVIPDGYGIVTAGLQALGACTDTNCLKCVASRATCTVCNYTAGYHMNTISGICTHTSSIVAGQGIDKSTDDIRTCVDARCVDCFTDTTYCNVCRDDIDIQGFGGLCHSLKAADNTTYISNYIRTPMIAEVRFNMPIAAISKIVSPLNISVIDRSDNRVYNCSTLDCQVQLQGDRGFDVRFDPISTMTVGDMYIHRSSSLMLIFSDMTVWKSYPIEVKDVSFVSKNKNLQRTVYIVQAADYAKLPMNLIVAVAAPSAAFYLDTLMNNMFYMKLLGGPVVYYPDVLLEATLNLGFIPWSFDNPIQEYGKKAPGGSKYVSTDFKRHQVSSNLLATEGTSFVIIMILLGITTAISVIASLLAMCVAKLRVQPVSRQILETTRGGNADSSGKRVFIDHQLGGINTLACKPTEKDPQSISLRFQNMMILLDKTYGLQFFFGKVEGNQVELVLSSIAAFMKPSGDGADVVSILVGAAILGLFGVLGYLKTRKAVLIRSMLIKAECMEDNDDRELPATIEKAIDLKSTPYQVLNYAFAELRPSRSLIPLLQPTINTIHPYAIATSVVLLASYPRSQIAVCMAVEISIIVMQVVCRPTSRSSETISETILRLTTVAYLAMKMTTINDEMSEQTRQENVGLAMALTILAMIGIAIGFALYYIWILAENTCRKFHKKCKACSEKKKLGTDRHSSSLPPSNTETIAKISAKGNFQSKHDMKDNQVGGIACKSPIKSSISARGNMKKKVMIMETLSANLLNANKALSTFITPDQTPRPKNSKASEEGDPVKSAGDDLKAFQNTEAQPSTSRFLNLDRK